MSPTRDPDDFRRDINERQRSYVFPDTVRNAGGFWRGLSNQTLSRFQWFGLFLLLAFYIALIVFLFIQQWPTGPYTLWEKLLHGYGPYLLLSLPLVIFFFVLSRSLNPKK
jgi:hypothetical protein